MRKKGQFDEAVAISHRFCPLIADNICSASVDKGTRKWWKNVKAASQKKFNSRDFDTTAENFNNFYADISAASNYIEPASAEAGPDLPELPISRVFNYLRRIKKTATGIDGISYWVYKENAHNPAEVLTEIFNFSLKHQQFPEC